MPSSRTVTTGAMLRSGSPAYPRPDPVYSILTFEAVTHGAMARTRATILSKAAVSRVRLLGHGLVAQVQLPALEHSSFPSAAAQIVSPAVSADPQAVVPT